MGIRRPRTAKQVAQLRRAQAISARKRRGRKIAKGVAIGGGLVAAGGAAYVANDRRKNVTLYHATSRSNAHKIAKGGFKQSSYDAGNGRRQTDDAAYFSKRKPSRHQRLNYGDGVVKVKVSRKATKGKLHRDVNHRWKKYYHIDRRIVNNPANAKISVVKGRKVRKGTRRKKK